MIEQFRPDLFAVLFPAIFVAIDWTQGYRFLDKELQRVVRAVDRGRRVVDNLVAVKQLGGDTAWVLAHIEVQSSEEAEFAARMFEDHIRLRGRYRRPIVSLAILADERATWRPTQYRDGHWGYRIQFRLPGGEARRLSRALGSAGGGPKPIRHDGDGPPDGAGDPEQSTGASASKVGADRRLYERGFQRRPVVDLLRFVDWVMALPPDLDAEYWETLEQYEEEQRTPYTMGIERRAIERGLQQGIAEGERRGVLSAIELALNAKFGSEASDILAEIRQVTERAALQAILQRVLTATTLDEVRRSLRDEA